MRHLWRAFRSPAGLACAIVAGFLLLGAGLVVVAAPVASLVTLGALAAGMAFAGSPTSSYQYAREVLGPIFDPSDPTLRFFHFSYIHSAGAGVGEVNLRRLPPGRWEIVCAKSSVSTNAAFVATADLHVGFRACKDVNGAALAADDNAFANNLDAGGGAVVATAFSLPAADYPGLVNLKLQSESGVVIYAMVDTANIQDTNEINGWVAARPW
jgi:hypothetical protein